MSDFSSYVKYRSKINFLPILIGILLCVLVGSLYWSFRQREENILRHKIKAEAEYLAGHMDADLKNRIPSLQRMVKRWELRGSMTRREFVDNTHAYLADVPGFQAIGWADKDFCIHWIVPLEGNESAINLNLTFEQNRRRALEKVKATRSPAMTAPVELIMGGKGFSIYFPLYLRGEFHGIILAAFRIQEWMDYVFSVSRRHRASDDFRIAAYINDEPVFRQKGWDDLKNSEWETMANSQIMGQRLSIHIRPTRNFLNQNKTLLPLIITLTGILFSALMVFIIYLLQNSSHQARKMTEAKLRMEREMAEHEKATRELQIALSRLDMAVKSGDIGVWTWDLDTDIHTWNERMYILFDLSREIQPTLEIILNRIHPDDMPGIEAALQNIRLGKTGYDNEFRVISQTKAVRHLRGLAKLERDANGRPWRINGINWDFTAWKESAEALKKNEEKLRKLLASLPLPICYVTRDGVITFRNERFSEIFGYTEEEVPTLAEWWIKAYPEEKYRQEVIQKWEAALGTALENGTDIKAAEYNVTCKDGVIRNILISGTAIADDFLVTFIDITEHKRAEQALRESEELYRSLIETSPDPIIMYDLKGRIIAANNQTARTYGVSGTDQFFKEVNSIFDLLADNYRDIAAANFLHTLETGSSQKNEYLVRLHNGQTITTEINSSIVRTATGQPRAFISVVRDITERKQAEERIQHLANHDALTGLPSLRLVKDRMAMAFGMSRRHNYRTAVMFIDLDGFKTVNDSLGHEAGDYVLKKVAQIFLACIRETDTVARVGGDEFIIVATALRSAGNAGEIAEKIIRMLSLPITFNGRKVSVGASIGIALYPDHGTDMENLIAQADTAMYRSKGSGKNRFTFADIKPQ
ncbi:MAG: Cyclic di-GMP phosphodiesterase Gmr [Smithella sp. PtaU1.Bin162]|nr:MAG: Cyclic di-GMP phosphodiesterase Gmr [Smithella sp. PtaU1.Bin162]